MRPRSWRLAHRAERHCGRGGELDVVVADDGQLTGDVDAHPGHLLQEAERQQVVRAERRRRPSGPWQSGDPFAGAPALGDVQRRCLEDEEHVGRAPARLHCLAGACHTVRDLHCRHRTADERDALVPVLAEVGHREYATLHVVDTDAAPGSAAGAIDEDHGDALATQHIERRRVMVDRGDQDAAHPLLEEQLDDRPPACCRCRCCR